MRHPRGTVGTENSNYGPLTYMHLNRYARAYTHTGLVHNSQLESLGSLNAITQRRDLHFYEGLNGRD
ncbi:hypothetical protein QFZ22_000393 [Streptomyces canus]|uniref:Tn3 transposase DDE domain-containing protein n=1 Tax=Streptomyces canus TaxID=58343 RepID=A0AAW8F3P9_9ACTN|nr:hypothetical protein [Streptomyces canus]